mgnify:CR=1 FL=1
MYLSAVNHIAIICSDYEKSVDFYCRILGFQVISQEYRAQRQSMMTKLSLNGEYLLELFTFPDSVKRASYPEACGLRHLAFSVPDIQEVLDELDAIPYPHEPLREISADERLFFMMDPDGLPIEIVEKKS